MRHKVRSSEYQRSFQGPGKDYCQAVHEELYTYRSQRRQLESAHQQIRWDSSDSSSCNSGSSSPTAEENIPNTECRQEDEPEPQVESDSLEGDQEPEEEINTDEEEKPKTRDKVSVEQKHELESVAETEKPPFLPYGWADKEHETAHKFTHNVRADNRYVYPSALKRQKLMKNKKLRQEEARTESRASVAAVLQSRQKAIANDIWMTEYQRCYSRQSARPATSGVENNRKNIKPNQRGKLKTR